MEKAFGVISRRGLCLAGLVLIFAAQVVLAMEATPENGASIFTAVKKLFLMK